MRRPGSTQLAQLKASTAAWHAHAETHVHILAPGATIADYEAYLAAMLGFHAPVEAALAGSTPLAAAGFDAPGRRKTGWLRADLAALGVSDSRTVCPSPPGLASAAAAVGAAYVLEGATLGGRFILSRLPAGLAGVRGRATRFLAGYQDQTGARWRGFGEVVERVVTSPAALDEAVAGACQTFARLCAWLAEVTPGEAAAHAAEEGAA